MILRRYGNKLESVEADFDARAMTEIGFRRDRVFSIPTDQFEEDYERVDGADLTATAEGAVQDEVEQAVLEQLSASLADFRSRARDGDVIVVENQQGVDYPKTREERANVIVGGTNQLRFTWHVDPPLKVALYRPR